MQSAHCSTYPLIRAAADSDVPAMAALLGELFSIEVDFKADQEVQRRGLRMLLEAPGRSAVWVAELGTRVVGMVSMQVVISTAEGAAVGILEDLVVTEGQRGRGVGSALLSAAEKWARCQGLSRIQLLADRDNLGALHFYTQRGWQTTHLVGLRLSRTCMDRNAVEEAF